MMHFNNKMGSFERRTLERNVKVKKQRPTFRTTLPEVTAPGTRGSKSIRITHCLSPVCLRAMMGRDWHYTYCGEFL